MTSFTAMRVGAKDEARQIDCVAWIDEGSSKLKRAEEPMPDPDIQQPGCYSGADRRSARIPWYRR
jgi:hypothetical protein